MGCNLIRIKPNEILRDSYGRYVFWERNQYIYCYIENNKVINCKTNEIIFDNLREFTKANTTFYKLPLMKCDLTIIPLTFKDIFTVYTYSELVNHYVIDIFFDQDTTVKCYQGNNITEFDFINKCIDMYYLIYSKLEEDDMEMLNTLSSLNYSLLIN